MSEMSRPTEEAKTESAYMKDSAFTVEHKSPKFAEIQSVIDERGIEETQPNVDEEPTSQVSAFKE